MKRLAIFILLSGVALIMASCVPVGISLRHVFFPDQLGAAPLPIADGDTPVRLQVPAAHEGAVRLALRVVLPAGGPVENAVDYRIEVRDGAGALLQRYQGTLNHDAASVREQYGTGDAQRVILEKRYEPIAVAAGTTLVTRISFSPADRVQSGEVRLYGPVPAMQVTLISALMMWTFGIVVALVGALWLLQMLTQVPGAQDVTLSGRQPDKEERLWAMACHLSVFSGYLFLPFGHIIAPMVIWLAKRDRSAFIDTQGRECLNFNLAVTLYLLAALLVCLTIIGLLVGLLLLFAVVVLHVAATLYAAIRAQQGDAVHYPLSIRFLSAPPASTPGAGDSS